MKPYQFLSAVVAMAALSAGVSRGEIALIPKPVGMTVQGGVYRLQAGTAISADEAGQGVARLLSESLSRATGFALPVRAGKGVGIQLGLDSSLTSLGDEGYTLDVTSKQITIRALKPAGLFYGTQTLRQLLPPAVYSKDVMRGVKWEAPCVKIEDRPRFVWRGAMLDVSRHFAPKAEVLKFIDLLAAQKMNVFHFHLTDDQGWRIEILKYPKLTEVGSRRSETLIGRKSEHKGFDGTPHAGFYTRQDIRDIVAYATARFVTVVPEIEMPGHATAAIAAYPDLGNTGKQLEVGTSWGVFPTIFSPREKTILFLQDVLTEVMELFPSKYIHIGGDEATKEEWKASPEVQALMKELALKDEEEMQSYFIRKMDEFLTAKGRRLLGWDEVLQGGLAAGATVMSWRGTKGGIAAAQSGHDVVMTPSEFVYLDYYQSKDKAEPLAIGGFLPLDKVYSYEPVPAELTSAEAGHVLGIQGNIWTEYIPSSDSIEYMAFPRLAAIAEIAWMPKREKVDFPEFRQRLATQEQRWKASGTNFRPLDKP